MLEQKCVTGIKTGITVNAVPCLCTAIELDEKKLVVCILCSKTMDSRWMETWKLAKWATSRLNKIKKF